MGVEIEGSLVIAGTLVAGVGGLLAWNGQNRRAEADALSRRIDAGEFALAADQSEWRGQRFVKMYETNQNAAAWASTAKWSGIVGAGLGVATLASSPFAATIELGATTAVIGAVAGVVSLVATCVQARDRSARAHAQELLTTPTGSRHVTSGG
jgi:hypothetical protein